MQIAITLLLSAMSLLTQVNSIPNISPELKLKAENVANFAIEYANNVINEQYKPVLKTNTEPVISFGSAPQIDSCIENPKLELSTTTDLTISDRYIVHAVYSTGCKLDPNTKFYYFADGWRTNSGVIGETGTDYWNYTVNSIPNYDSFTMTVGTTTKNF